jgi:hypothetical protein
VGFVGGDAKFIEGDAEADADFASAHSGCFEESMTLCVESLIGEKDRESIKLGTQVLVTANGAVRLDSFPIENID